jgi:dTDP-glucose 4,6-dehydratase
VRRHIITGGAGFIGSHLCEALIERGDAVVCVDDFSSGSEENIEALAGSERFELLHGDACGVLDKVDGPVDAVAHLASPAAPADYLAHPLETLAVGSRGTEAALRLAQAHGARFVLTSTSEVYGDPLVHPQREDYWGNVNPVGPRSVYDEAKRFSEALTAAFHRTLGLDTGIVRIFNTYGPRLRAGDGRVVSNFIVQALSNQPLTIYGDGSQTRSFCYVDDLVIPEGALVVKTALLEEEHDFGAVVVLST